MQTQYHRCMQLRNIPESKFNTKKISIISNCDKCSSVGFISCDKCSLLDKLYGRYYSGNIPVDYWDKKISDFYGDKKMVSLYDQIFLNIDQFLSEGMSLFLKGQHGVGKTLFASLVLKKMAEKGYNVLYTTLFDIVSAAIQGDYKDKYDSVRELKMTDLLVIDEFDPRFFSNDNSAELFGRILESIIRIRFQNKISTIMITNNPDPTKAFGDSLKASIDSLISGYCKQIYVIGPDARNK